MHFIKKASISILLISLCSCQNETRKSHFNFQSQIDSLDRELTAISNKIIIPGFSVAVIHNDNLLLNKGYGYRDLLTQKRFTKNTPHSIASISKTFIGVSLMKLVEQGKLSLDEPINNILPFQIINPHHPDIPITVRHLATHTSSITDDYEDGDKKASWFIEPLPTDLESYHVDLKSDIDYYNGRKMSNEEFIKKICVVNEEWYSEDNFLNHKPGERYEYSNTGASIAGYIIELVSGMTFPEFTRKYIFTPLQMNQTSWFYTDLEVSSKMYAEKTIDGVQKVYEFPRYHEAGYPDGQLKTSSTDLSYYVLEMMKGFHGKGTLLKKSSYKILLNEQLERKNFESDDTDPLSDEYNSGIFWGISPVDYRIHSGGMYGVYSLIYFDPESNIGILAIANMADSSFGNILNALGKAKENMEEKLQ